MFFFNKCFCMFLFTPRSSGSGRFKGTCGGGKPFAPLCCGHGQHDPYPSRSAGHVQECATCRLCPLLLGPHCPGLWFGTGHSDSERPVATPTRTQGAAVVVVGAKLIAKQSRSIVLAKNVVWFGRQSVGS